MDEITKKAWEVFRSAFQDGESVVVEDHRGRFFYGKLRAAEDGILLTRSGVKGKFLEWDDIEFIAHDGFPVQPIMGMTAEEAARRAAMEPTDIVREALELGVREAKEEKEEEEREKEREKARPVRHYKGGCPWVAEGNLLAIHNRGNTAPIFQHWPYDGLAEVMVFGSADGALMHSYDSEHLFLNG